MAEQSAKQRFSKALISTLEEEEEINTYMNKYQYINARSHTCIVKHTNRERERETETETETEKRGIDLT